MIRRAILAGAALCALTGAACAGPIPSYPPATQPLTGAEQLVCGQAGVTKECSVSSLTSAAAAIPGAVPSTGKWFSNNSANIVRLNDRVLVGGASTNSADFPLTTYDWLTTFENSIGQTSAGTGLVVSTMLPVLTTRNANDQGGAITGAAQTLYGTGAESINGIAVNNCSSGCGAVDGAWGFYGEGWITTATAAGTCCTYAEELDVYTNQTIGFSEPYAHGVETALLLACGAGVTTGTAKPCPSALEIDANTQPFLTGINFVSGSLQAGAVAIAFPQNTIELQQWTSDGHVGSFWQSNVTTFADGTGIFTDNTGFHVRNTNSQSDIAIFPFGGNLQVFKYGSAFEAQLDAVNLTANQDIVLPSFTGVLGLTGTSTLTVATLPVCNAAIYNQGEWVSDGSTATPTYGAVAVGGGANTEHLRCGPPGWVYG